MAYCVKCGVKLAKSEEKCPLCNTPVINPDNFIDETLEFNYPNKIDKLSGKKVDWKYVIKLVIFICVFLSGISIFCDALTSGKLSWSIYVVCSVIFLGCQLSFLYFKNIYIPVIISLLSAELLMFVIAFLNNGMHWYLYLVMPFILIIMMYILICIVLFRRRKKSILRSLSICFLFCGLTLILIESLVDLYNSNIVALSWSIYATLPITIIGILIYLLSYNKKLVEEIKQKIFI